MFREPDDRRPRAWVPHPLSAAAVARGPGETDIISSRPTPMARAWRTRCNEPVPCRRGESCALPPTATGPPRSGVCEYLAETKLPDAVASQSNRAHGMPNRRPDNKSLRTGNDQFIPAAARGERKAASSAPRRLLPSLHGLFFDTGLTRQHPDHSIRSCTIRYLMQDGSIHRRSGSSRPAPHRA
jgi:hypothetical protein